MMNHLKHIVLTLFCYTFLSLNAQQVKITFDKDTILIGDHLLLNIQVETHDGERIFLPEFADTIGNFDLIEIYKADTLKNTISQNILLTQFNAGNYQFGQIPALVQRKNGSTDTIVSNNIMLTVNTIEVDTTLAIKPIKNIKAIPFPWKVFLKKLAIIVLPILLIIGLIFWYLIYKKKLVLFKEKPKTMFDFYVEALQKLEELDKKKLWQNDHIKEYYLGVSEVLRNYLEGRFGIQAMERTTDEIRTELFLEKDLKDKLSEILEQADLAKFAKFKPMQDENLRMMKMAKDFVKNTKPQKTKEENA